MTKGVILTNEGEGLYRVRLEKDTQAAQARVDYIDQRLLDLVQPILDAQLLLQGFETQQAILQAQIDAAITLAKQEGRPATRDELQPIVESLNALAVDLLKAQRDYNRLIGERLSLSRERTTLQSRIDGADTIEADLWCADYTLDLAVDAEVGLILSPGENTGAAVVIRPGYEAEPSGEPGLGASYAEAFGTLTPAFSATPAGVFFNWAMEPGWSKWRPTYRYGEITALNGNACDVMLDEMFSSSQDLPVNQSAALSDVPITYMDCDGEAFAVGDRVAVEFEEQDWEQPRVIGFESNPKECPSGIFLETGLVWWKADFLPLVNPGTEDIPYRRRATVFEGDYHTDLRAIDPILLDNISPLAGNVNVISDPRDAPGSDGMESVSYFGVPQAVIDQLDDFDPQTFDPYDHVPAVLTTAEAEDLDEGRGIAHTKRLWSAYCPPSLFTGRLRWWLQAKLGSTKRDASIGVFAPNGIPHPTMRPRISGEAIIDGFGLVAYRDTTVDPTEHHYYLIDLSDLDGNARYRELFLPPAAVRILQVIDENPALDSDQLECYALSVATLTAAMDWQTIGPIGDLQGQAIAGSWKFSTGRIDESSAFAGVVLHDINLDGMGDLESRTSRFYKCTFGIQQDLSGNFSPTISINLEEEADFLLPNTEFPVWVPHGSEFGKMVRALQNAGNASQGEDIPDPFGQGVAIDVVWTEDDEFDVIRWWYEVTSDIENDPFFTDDDRDGAHPCGPTDGATNTITRTERPGNVRSGYYSDRFDARVDLWDTAQSRLFDEFFTVTQHYEFSQTRPETAPPSAATAVSPLSSVNGKAATQPGGQAQACDPDDVQDDADALQVSLRSVIATQGDFGYVDRRTEALQRSNVGSGGALIAPRFEANARYVAGGENYTWNRTGNTHESIREQTLHARFMVYTSSTIHGFFEADYRIIGSTASGTFVDLAASGSTRRLNYAMLGQQVIEAVTFPDSLTDSNSEYSASGPWSDFFGPGYDSVIERDPQARESRRGDILYVEDMEETPELYRVTGDYLEDAKEEDETGEYTLWLTWEGGA